MNISITQTADGGVRTHACLHIPELKSGSLDHSDTSAYDKYISNYFNLNEFFIRIKKFSYQV